MSFVSNASNVIFPTRPPSLRLVRRGRENAAASGGSPGAQPPPPPPVAFDGKKKKRKKKDSDSSPQGPSTPTPSSRRLSWGANKTKSFTKSMNDMLTKEIRLSPVPSNGVLRNKDAKVVVKEREERKGVRRSGRLEM